MASRSMLRGERHYRRPELRISVAGYPSEHGSSASPARARQTPSPVSSGVGFFMKPQLSISPPFLTMAGGTSQKKLGGINESDSDSSKFERPTTPNFDQRSVDSNPKKFSQTTPRRASNHIDVN